MDVFWLSDVKGDGFAVLANVIEADTNRYHGKALEQIDRRVDLDCPYRKRPTTSSHKTSARLAESVAFC